jgi:hypothetical protein
MNDSFVPLAPANLEKSAGVTSAILRAEVDALLLEMEKLDTVARRQAATTA